MCGGGPTTTTGGTSKVEVPEYIRKASKGNIGAANQYASQYGNDTPLTRQAFGSIVENSNWANDYMMPYQQQLIQSLYEGGGMGEGADYIRDAYGQASNAYQPYLSEGYLDPMTNPYLQPAIEAARSSSFNDVADRFHKAGRSFSGAESGAYGTAATNAALPMLLGQYNQNVGAQQGAAQGLLAGATGASSGLTQAQQAVLQAKMAAPGQIGNLNIPENMLLGIADRRQQSALQGLNAKIAALSGAPFASTTTTSGTTSQQSDPFQTMLGGGLGLLGMFM
jgi:hypothetical protein